MVGEAAGPNVVGIDLGGTKIAVGIVDAEHRILGRAKRPTPAKEGGPAILARMIECVQQALLDAHLQLDDVACVGVGSPGPLDPEAGVIRSSPNLNVRDFPLGPDLALALKRPVLLQNDVRVGGYGEFRLGAGRHYQDILAVFVGTGIGGCVIQGGTMLTGVTGNAGEVGHVVVKAKGPKCGCGNRGCVEAIASRSAITRRIHKAIRRGAETSLSRHVTSKSSVLKSRELASAYLAGDPVANESVHRSAHYLGLALGSLINVLSPQVVIVGGGVTEALGDAYVDLIRHSAHAQAMADPDHRVRIERAELGDDAGILGASLLAREQFL